MKMNFLKDYVDVECCNCGVIFFLSEEMDTRRRKDHDSFYCPSGHSQSYKAKSEEQKLRERLLEKERELEMKDRQLQNCLSKIEKPKRSRTKKGK